MDYGDGDGEVEKGGGMGKEKVVSDYGCMGVMVRSYVNQLLGAG